MAEGDKEKIADLDSAGVYFMTIEEFEGRPPKPPPSADRDDSEEEPSDKPKPPPSRTTPRSSRPADSLEEGEPEPAE